MIGKNNTSRDASAEVERMVVDAVGATDSFLGLTASGPMDRGVWEKARVRPVEIKGVRALQFNFIGSGKSKTDVIQARETPRALKELVRSFSRFNIQSTTGDAHIRVTEKGRVLVSRGRPEKSGFVARQKEESRAVVGSAGCLSRRAGDHEPGRLDPSVDAGEVPADQRFYRVVKACD